MEYFAIVVRISVVAVAESVAREARPDGGRPARAIRAANQQVGSVGQLEQRALNLFSERERESLELCVRFDELVCCWSFDSRRALAVAIVFMRFEKMRKTMQMSSSSSSSHDDEDNTAFAVMRLAAGASFLPAFLSFPSCPLACCQSTSSSNKLPGRLARREREK